MSNKKTWTVIVLLMALSLIVPMSAWAGSYGHHGGHGYYGHRGYHGYSNHYGYHSGYGYQGYYGHYTPTAAEQDDPRRQDPGGYEPCKGEQLGRSLHAASPHPHRLVQRSTQIRGVHLAHRDQPAVYRQLQNAGAQTLPA